MKNKKLSVGHIHWAYEPIIGGVETHLKILLPDLVKRGIKVGLLTSSVEGYPNQEKKDGIHIYRTPYLNLDFLVKMKTNELKNNLIRVYIDFINELKPDILHVHNFHYFSKTHIKTLEYIAKDRDIPIILTAHNVWNDNLFLQIIYDVDWSHIIAVSHYIKRELWGFGIREDKITVIHHGIDINLYRPGVDTKKILKKYSQLKGKKVVFHPARVSLAKGGDISIKAMNLVRRHFKDAFLVLAGNKNIIDWNGAQQEDFIYMSNLIKRFKMEKNILVDAFNREEMIQLYNLAKVSLYPSTAQEPFGLTMLESQACGTPIIVTKSGGMPEVIHDKINGIVIQREDFSQLAFSIIYLLGDDELRKRLGDTGREIVCLHYNKELMVNSNIKIYEKVLNK